MSEHTQHITTRRDFLKRTGRIAAVSTLAGGLTSSLHAAGSDAIQVALIGCGGRGSGAANDAMNVEGRGPIKLVAMADVFEHRLNSSYKNLKTGHPDQVDVPKERQFIGFDAYKKAMDCLRPGDIAIFATPPAFRWVHFKYAIQKGLHVFMEKPVTVDGPTTKRMIELGKQADAKNLKVGVGLMSRHSRALQELHDRIADGEIGDIVTMRGYRMHGVVGFFASPPKPEGISDLLYQVQRFHSFIWASGGCYSDFYIHVIDHLCWMKNAWPVKAQAVGGRHYRGDSVDQNFDTYGVEYIFEDGCRFFFDGRTIQGCEQIYSSAIHGTKGSAIASNSGDCGLPSATYKGQNPDDASRIWRSRVPMKERNPYQNEWNDLVDAIIGDKPYNEVERGALGSMVTSMGRMAAHTGRVITFDQILNCKHEMAPTLESLTMTSDAPLKADANGRYPIPQPGIVTDQEYKDFA